MAESRNPVLNHKAVLRGLVGDFGLKEYKVVKQEEPNTRTHIVPARNEAQCVRICRKYLGLAGTLEVYSQACWESRNLGGPDPSVYPEVDGFVEILLSEQDEDDEC